MKTQYTLGAAALLLAALVSTPALAEKYYKWTDDSGVVHYALEKPTDRESEETTVLQSSGEAPVAVDSAAAAEAAQTFGANADPAAPKTAEQEALTKARAQAMACSYATGGLETAQRFYLASMRPEESAGLRSSETYKQEMQEMANLKSANCVK